MSKSNPNYTISASNTTPAVTVSNNTLTSDSSASPKMGSVTLMSNDKFAKMEAMLEFVERFVEEDERAKAIWVAIKAKKRILG